MKYRMASYELYALAVVAFFIDHGGEYFFGDNLWLRSLRLFALIWFFPLGYNSAWRSRPKVWIGLIALTGLDTLIFVHVLPISALGTLLLMRYLVDPVMAFALRSRAHFWGVQAALALLIWPSSELVEYGTMALLIANAGWLVRHKDRLPKGIVDLPSYFVFMTAVFLAFTQMNFEFSPAQLAFVTASCAATSWLLYNFTDLIREDLRRRKHRADIVERAARFIANNTLEIYVAHLAVFKLMILYANQ
jgi:hypothetical protein